MNDSSELQAACKKREAEWREYGLGDRHLTEFVAEHHGDFDSLEYDLRELFSEEALSAILTLGVTTIDANRRGVRMATFGSGGIREGKLEDGVRLMEVFRRWADTGLIYFALAAGEGTTVADLLGATAPRQTGG